MSDLHDAVGSYVVHALDDLERREFEDHLATCGTCRRDVDQFSEVTAQLADSLATPPPPELRSAILRRITSVSQLPAPSPPAAEVEEAEGAPARRPRHATAGEAATTQATSPPARPSGSATVVPATELELRRQRRLRRVLTGAVAAALVAVLALGGWAYSINSARQQTVAAARAQRQLLAAADAKIYTKRLDNGSQVSIVVSKHENKALLVSENLPSPGANKTYQLWTIASAKPLGGVRPDNLVPGGGAADTFFRGPVQTSQALALSIERSGGSTQPTTIVLVQPLT